MGTISEKIEYLIDTKLAIKEAILSKGGTISDTDTFRSYASKIEEIPAGESSKYGVSADAFLGELDEDGNLLSPSGFSINLNVSGIGEKGLYYKFYYSGIEEATYQCTTITGDSAMSNCHSYAQSLTSVSFPELTTISGTTTMENCFNNCTNLVSVSFPELTTISGTNTMKGCFNSCKNLTSISYPSLTTISGSSTMNSCHAYNSVLKYVSFPNLTTISGSSVMTSCFSRAIQLTSISFPSLTEILPENEQSQFNNMFQYCTGLTSIHFPAAMQERIEQLTGYSSKFGATNATIYFDL